jgi:hypothetical protein
MINLAQLPAGWPAQNSWSNRIHRDDAAAFMVFLVQQVLAGKNIEDCYIVTDSMPVPQHEVLLWLADRLGIEVPSHIATHSAPPIEGGKRLSNQTMLATGFLLQYPHYKAGYQALLDEYL